jgi:hypothetical protein
MGRITLTSRMEEMPFIIWLACYAKRWQPHQQDRCAVGELPAHTETFTSFQEVYKEAKTKQIPDDEPVHANKDKNRVMECPNTFPEGKLAQLNREMDRYKLDILGVSEVRWNGSGQIMTTDGKMFLYSGM